MANSELLKALLGVQEMEARTNPWTLGGQSVLSQEAPVIGNGFLGAFLPKVAQGFVGGAMSGYGRGQAQKQSGADMSLMGELLANPERKQEIFSDNPDFAEKYGSIFNYQSLIDALSKSELKDEIAKIKTRSFVEAAAKNPRLWAQLQTNADGTVSLIDNGDDPNDVPITKEDESNPLNPMGGMDVRKRAAISRIQEMDPAVSPREARMEASQNFAAEEQGTKNDLKNTSANAAKSGKIKALSQQAQSAIGDAGYTGPLNKFTYPFRLGISALEPLWGGDSFTRDLNAEALLDSPTGPLAMGQREPGSGNFSDADRIANEKNMASSNRTPEVNRALAKALEIGADRAQQQDRFYRWYVAGPGGGSTTGAAEIWDQYLEENPVWKESGSELATTNPQTFFAWLSTKQGGATSSTSPLVSGRVSLSQQIIPGVTGGAASASPEATLKSLALQFPNTPEGRSQFKQEAVRQGLIK